jgi:hypothetical protein
MAGIAIMASPVRAEVIVVGIIEKDRDVTVTETIDKVKTVNINAQVDIALEKAAESYSHVNQLNTENQACENCAEKADILKDAANSNSGVLSINQAAGNMNNQGNAVSVAFDSPDQEPTSNRGFADATAAAHQVMLDNTINSRNIGYRRTEMTGSMNGNNGIVHANQAAGNINNQANSVSIAVSLAPGVALSEADLGQVNRGNSVKEVDVNKSASVSNSLNGNIGIVGVNQASGNNANQANVVAFSAAARFN